MICFAWSGFPQYAARCVGAYVRSTTEKGIVVATRPRVPVEGMEKYCGCTILWVNPDDAVDAATLIGEVPDTLIVNGWSISAFNQLRDQVRANGGRVIVSIDNNFQFSLKEIIKAIRFRIKYRHLYDGFLVPGRSGVRLLRFYGVPQGKIAIGMYAADASLFKSVIPICERPKRIIYVGQICERKNVKALVNAFVSLAPRFPDWSLDLYGSGPLSDEINTIIKQSRSQHVCLNEFLQPELLADAYNRARIFILPSKEEHWGLVVHEAALSGCVLLVSKQVGAANDFVAEENGMVFDALDEKSLKKAMSHAMQYDENSLVQSERVSLRLSKNASLEQFVKGINQLRSLMK